MAKNWLILETERIEIKSFEDIWTIQIKFMEARSYLYKIFLSYNILNTHFLDTMRKFLPLKKHLALELLLRLEVS